MIGKTIGQYKITEKLGAGGMGEVFLAEDSKLQRKVALKFLPEKFSADPEFKSRFQHEARAAAALNHPNIITVYDLGENEGKLFIAMEHVDGSPLNRIIEKDSLSLNKALDIAAQCAEGLSAAHQAGIVHRDVKPGNILLDNSGRVRILDFGLAKSHRATTETVAGSTLGTVQYESPEQTSGADVDQRSDIFSLGVVIYELVTGRLPFAGEYEAAIRYAITHETPEPLARFKANTPDDLQRILNKALAKDPAERYQSMADMLVDIRRVRRDSQPVDRSPVPAPAVVKHSRLRIALLAGALVVSTLIAGYFIINGIEQSSSLMSSENPTRIMIAVLPFENLGDTDDEYFADGITEEITARLAGVTGLGVIARTSVMKYKGTTKSIGEIGSDLGVDYVLEGTVRWQKSSGAVDRVRVTPQLIKVSDGAHKWANIYDEDMAEVFTVQSDIAKGITEALGIALGKHERKSLDVKHTDNLAAYDFYLRGNDYWYQNAGGTDIKALKLASQLYSQALAADPAFVPALARLAQMEIETYWHNSYDSTDLNEAWRYVQQALTLDSNSVEARIALGSYYYHDYEYDKALEEFFRVLAKQPSNADALMEIAYVYQRRADFEESLKFHRQAAKFDPLRAAHVESVANCLTSLHRFDEAEKTYYKAIALAPDLANPYAQLAWLVIARDGDIKRARKVISDAETIVNPSAGFYDAGFILAVWDGDFQTALRYSDLSRPLELGDGDYHLRMAYSYRIQNKSVQERKHADSAYTILQTGAAQNAKLGLALEMKGLALASLGRFEEAIEQGKKSVELEIRRNLADDHTLSLARIYLSSGDEDAALDNLEKVLNMPSFVTTKTIQLNPYWKPLHDNPRYIEMMKKYEIPSS